MSMKNKVMASAITLSLIIPLLGNAGQAFADPPPWANNRQKYEYKHNHKYDKKHDQAYYRDWRADGRGNWIYVGNDRRYRQAYAHWRPDGHGNWIPASGYYGDNGRYDRNWRADGRGNWIYTGDDDRYTAGTYYRPDGRGNWVPINSGIGGWLGNIFR